MNPCPYTGWANPCPYTVGRRHCIAGPSNHPGPHDWTPQPAPDPSRCPGSLQTVLDASGPATPCPVCRATIAAVPLDGLPVLAEHRRAAAEALPMALAW